MSLKKFFRYFNIVDECKAYKVSVFACPPFLFIVIGVVIIIAMLVTTVLAERFSGDPSVVVISVAVMAAFLFIIGHAVVNSFQRLADASQMKSEFVSIVSHQLRSPLSAIKWQLELMLENVTTIPKETHETITVLKEQNERMIELVNNLLEVNRIDDDRLVLRSSIIQINEFIQNLIKEYGPVSEKFAIRLSCSVAGTSLWVFADDAKLRWITENLLENAMRYTLKGGEVKVQVSKDGSSVRVEVADSGVGIPIRDQEKIFTKFFRAENAIRIRTQGSGLGLYLVKSLAAAMGGKVGFASLEGKGSTFWYSLPLVRAGEEISKQ